MTKRVAILQPNYIPWRGYFDLLAQVDEFIIYDDTQYTRRDWRNRNKIMLHGSERWLSIPVDVSGKYHQLISDVRIADPKWQNQHAQSLRHAYGKAPYFNEVWDVLAPLYEGEAFEWLLDADTAFLEAIKSYLGLTTKLTLSSDYKVEGAKTEKLIGLCARAGATHYVSGPAAKAYIDPALFCGAGIGLSYIEYPQYPAYAHVSRYQDGLSIVDALMHCDTQVTSQFTAALEQVAA